MKSWKKPTNEMVDKALGSIKKVTARKYFFSRLENPLWLKPLAERGRFKYPPEGQRYNDGTVEFPYWPEIQYLKNVCKEVPDQVINLITDLPQIDNPVVYDGILDIALQLPGKQSAKLKEKVLEYAGMEHQWQTYKYEELLAYWTAEDQTSDALELLKILVKFTTERRSTDLDVLPDPLPQIDLWDYRDMMLEGVRPLAEKEPYRVALILIDATTNMIRLQTHSVDHDKEEDGAELWCQHLRESDDDYENPKETLVHTLTFACEKVFEKSPNTIADLDKVLRKQQWKIFKRLRHHLYAQYPNEKTKPWIREAILTHEDYNEWEHPYEFQQMIRGGCEHFGDVLLTKEERIRIFDAILSGPSKEDFHDIAGDKFTEELFQKRQHYFHRMQLMPFAPVLFGEYRTYFQKLEGEVNDVISDDNYRPIRTEIGLVSNRSPQSPEDLANLTDEALLTYINNWEKGDKLSGGDIFVDINIEALADAFQTVFRESIIPNANRLKFWIENREGIERPIYVRSMIDAMQADVKERNFDQLNRWLIFSEWVLSHPDGAGANGYGRDDKSRENPNWSTARRAVCGFISTCLEEDVDVPIFEREQLVKLLEMLCTQFDWRLDNNIPTILNRYDPLTEGINHTRSRGLQELINFGFWLRRHDSENEISEVTIILEKRFAQETDYPLTLPEYAVLAVNYHRIFYLNEAWAVKHKPDFFPREKLSAWLTVFGCFVSYSRPFKRSFEILQDDFNFSLENIDDFKEYAPTRSKPVDSLGEHLFTYYLWEMYSLEGKESLLGQFYQRTDRKREHWANLFNYVGRRLRDSGKHLDPKLKDRIIAFFEWRFKEKEPIELQYFTSWLEVKCLGVEWRLDAYSRILDVCDIVGRRIWLEALRDMLPNHTAKVVECFFKITEKIKKGHIYIRSEEAKAILKAGRESSDEDVRYKAERALDNLLKSGRFDVLDLED